MKHYTKPETTVVKLQQQHALLTGSQLNVNQFNSTEFTFGGGAYIDARTREQSIWGEEW